MRRGALLTGRSLKLLTFRQGNADTLSVLATDPSTQAQITVETSSDLSLDSKYAAGRYVVNIIN
jgi:hypothetical protein